MKIYGKLVYSNEGVIRERKFKTEDEARAYALGISDAKEQTALTDEDQLEDYFGAIDEKPATIEN